MTKHPLILSTLLIATSSLAIAQETPASSAPARVAKELPSVIVPANNYWLEQKFEAMKRLTDSKEGTLITINRKDELGFTVTIENKRPDISTEFFSNHLTTTPNFFSLTDGDRKLPQKYVIEVRSPGEKYEYSSRVTIGLDSVIGDITMKEHQEACEKFEKEDKSCGTLNFTYHEDFGLTLALKLYADPDNDDENYRELNLQYMNLHFQKPAHLQIVAKSGDDDGASTYASFDSDLLPKVKP